MTKKGQRIVSFAGSAVAIECSGAQSAAITDMIFQRAPADGGVAPHITYRVQPGGHSEELALFCDRTLIYEGRCQATLGELLLGEICRHLADRSRGGLLFHAAGLARGDQGLLLPGEIGAGKSTLAAWLATKGFEYLTDELVFVPHETSTIRSFGRPLNLKGASRIALQNVLEGHVACALRGDQVDLILPKSAGPSRDLPLRLVIFPRYLPEGDFVLERLSKAQAGLALMQCLINARNLPDHGFSEIARLARIAPAYKMHYGGLSQIEEQIERLLSSPETGSFRGTGVVTKRQL